MSNIPSSSKFEVTVPNGKKGPWAISRFEVSNEDAKAFNIGQIMSRVHGYRPIQPGKYVRLTHNVRGVIMSNTPAEVNDHYEPYTRAQGHCLIHGLGLGMITAAVLRKENVERVTVVEIDKDVIDLVAPHLHAEFGDRFQVIHMDSMAFVPLKIRYGIAWHDIWDSISCDNKPQMSTLHRRYGRLVEWQGSWGKPDIERMMREDRRW